MYRTRPQTIRRATIAVMLLAGAVTATITTASEDRNGGSSTRTIVMQDEDRIFPSTLTMNRADVLEFENDSGEFVELVFVEPPDQDGKIRCYLTDHTAARPDAAPWLGFTRSPGRRLTATLPPGRFASACSLAPGQYAFVTRPFARDPHGFVDSLGTKGTITVE